MNTTHHTDNWTTFDALRAQWEVEHQITESLKIGRDSLRAHAIVVLMLLPLIGMLGAAGHQLSATIGAAVFGAAVFISLGVHVWLVEHRRPAVARAGVVTPEAPMGSGAFPATR